MSVELVNLENSAIDPRARRYTEDEKAGAYLLWRTVCGRSLRKVSARLNISMPSLIAWSKEQEWKLRADDEDREEFASSHLGVASIVVHELVPSIEKMRYLRDHAADERVQSDAAKWLAGLAGVSPVSKIETSVIRPPSQSTDVIEVAALVGKTPDELNRIEEQAKRKRPNP